MKKHRTGSLAVVLLAICLLPWGFTAARSSVTGRSELQIVSFSEEEEAALGVKAYVPAVQQQGGFYRDPALEEYVQGVGCGWPAFPTART